MLQLLARNLSTKHTGIIIIRYKSKIANTASLLNIITGTLFTDKTHIQFTFLL